MRRVAGSTVSCASPGPGECGPSTPTPVRFRAPGRSLLDCLPSVEIHPGQTVSGAALARELRPAANLSFNDIESSLLEHGVSLHLFTVGSGNKERRGSKPTAF